MGKDIRCPHCNETFFAGGAEPPGECPACGKGLALAAPAPAFKPAVKPAKGAAMPTANKTCPSCSTPYPVSERKCPACGVSYRVAKGAQEEETGSFAPEKAGVKKGVLGGVIMIAIAAIWFFAGLAADRIFFYPPVLAVIGIYSVIKGLATGNLAGEKKPPLRRGR